MHYFKQNNQSQAGFKRCQRTDQNQGGGALDFAPKKDGSLIHRNRFRKQENMDGMK